MNGSLANRIMEGPGQPVPEAGMAATVMHWSDRDPATVVAVRVFKSGARKGQPREIDIQHDDWEVISGSVHDGSAEYAYTRNESAPLVTYRVNSKGEWVRKGGSGKLSLGGRNRFQNPHH